MIPPTISIITVVFNGSAHIGETIESVLSQSYSHIEYLIIDGGSTDGTTDVIDRYRSQLSHVTSEPDQGIYDAMNKALRAATGDYVWFINAGDTIHSEETVSQIFQAPQSDIYYGHVALKRDDRLINTLKAPVTLCWRDMYKGMIFSHQSFIVRRSLVQQYDLQYQYIADYDWIIEALKRAEIIQFVDQPLSNYLLGGYSEQNFGGVWRDRFTIARRHFSGFRLGMQYYFFAKALAKWLVKRVLFK